MTNTAPDRTVPPQVGSLARGRLGTWGVVLFVFAVTTPLVGLASMTGLAMTLGSGIGIVGLYVVAGVCLLCFQAGYSAMSTEVTNAGAFYAYITRGFGRIAGLAASMLSVVYYNLVAVILAAMFGFYANVAVLNQLHVDIPWQVWTGLAIVITFVFGRRNIEVSMRLLAVAVGLETIMAVVFLVAVIARQGITAFSLDVFKPTVMFAGTIGVAVMMAIYPFGGMEANAIFGEEARHMKRTVRRAGYLGVCCLTVFYAVTAWALVAALGAANAQGKAMEFPGTVFYEANTAMVGLWSTYILQWMVCLSLLASLLGLHNMCMRYFFSLGRDGVFPRVLAKTHPKTQSPYHAGEVQIGCLIVIMGAFMLAGADPMLTIVTGLGGIMVLSMVFLWAWVSAAAVAYFWKRRDVNLWETKIAPIISTLLMLVLCVVILIWYTDITGATGVLRQLPWIIPPILLFGVVYALWLRRYRPATYAIVGQLSISEGLDVSAAEPESKPEASASSDGAE